ncbi:AlpA family phage regulatory protein [Roseovarius faecimaris]|uniref:AlpA family phage regulatory protein n=1 Tax=Roseovarius faecimaris TaxID=2494550 RepID=A0A6I6ILM0_9RHOB|nr:AlpA family phage regulatory protein [Roseovarius faecimaris]QGX97192.1 AlpA family phage regulatory protein [Roseovarius faecimaris]
MNFINFEQLSAKLGGRSRTSLYRDVKLGRLPAPMKMGRRVYWNEAEVDAAVQEYRVGQDLHSGSNIEAGA